MAVLGTILAGLGTAAGASAGAAAGGIFGTGLSFWQLAGAAFSGIATLATISGNNAAASAEQFRISQQLEAGALEAARTRRAVEREGQQLAARRVASLAAQGGTGVGGTFDLLMEPLMETSLEGIQRLTEIEMESASLIRRSRAVSKGTAMANIGALASGAAKTFSLLSR